MCGIGGVVGLDAATSEFFILADQSNRGPDGHSELSGEGFFFLFDRLAIVDELATTQPFRSRDGIISLTNGEIYNHASLRSSHLAGFEFRTNNDCEVVGPAFHKYGVECFMRMTGMWASAVYDPRTRELTLARDVHGKKPLFYATQGSEIAFSSSSQIAASRSGDNRLDMSEVAAYFSLGHSRPSNTLYSGVREVPKNSALTLSKGSVVRRSTISQGRSNAGTLNSKWIEKISNALIQSTADRLMADGTPGIFLSGGADSAAVAAALRSCSDDSVPAYILDLPEAGYSESEVATTHARLMGLEPVIVKGSLEELAKQAMRVGESFDQPMSDPACLGVMSLSEAANETGTKFVLTGDGADEIFGTYQTFDAHTLRETLFPSPLAQKIAEKLSLIIPETPSYFSLGFRAKKFAQGVGIDDPFERDIRWRSPFTPSEIRSLLLPNLLGSLEEIDSWVLKQDRQVWDKGDLRPLYLDTYLSELLLKKVDRSTMRFGIEARSPFLGKQVFDLVMSLKIPFWSSSHQRKLVIWAIASQISGGARFQSRRKHGFGMPLAALFNGPLRARALRNLDTDRIVEQALFQTDYTNSLAKSIGNLTESSARKLWAIFAFQEWYFESKERGLIS